MRIGNIAAGVLVGVGMLLAGAGPASGAPGGTGPGSGAPDLGSAITSPAGTASVSQTPTEPGPPQSTHAAAADYADLHPGSVPPGVNDFSCLPTPAHPNPVVLAHGSDSSAYSDWAAIGPRLAESGFCVFAVNYGGAPGATSFATEDMHLSAGQLREFVERVRSDTGAAKVDLLGFSQGATVARYYVNRLGGAAVVDRWIGVASPTYGGIFYGLVPAADAIPGGRAVVSLFTTVAVAQQAQGSDFLTALNAGGDTVPGVRYTTIATRYDEMIQPYTNIALRDPGATNILIQDLCPQDMTGHMNMVYDEFTIGLVMGALDANVPAPACTTVPLGTGMIGMIGR